ncbi:MAG: type II toxin-antitoxin system CcdA family antitoxin [Gammaproteobacteria bacterium]
MNLYDINASKKATNLTINSDLLAKAKLLHINLSKTLEDSLIKLLQDKQNQLWLQQNKLAINEYNERIDKDGSFGDKGRLF